MRWNGSIFDAKESKDEDAPKEGKDGNYTYTSYVPSCLSLTV